MTVTEFVPLSVKRSRKPELAQPHGLESFEVLDTTELRWFVPGLLPADVGHWFVGPAGGIEERCDTYLLDGRRDVGVKRRCRETLELKVRQSLDGGLHLTDGLSGPLEVWRRWSPAERLVEGAADSGWVDVCKSIVKRRFSQDGSEIAFSTGTPTTGAGCDVEIAQVTVGSIQAWTFAFAAFGPIADRPNALIMSWRGLVAATKFPTSLSAGAGRAMGYPEWLTLTVAPHLRQTSGHRQVARSH